MLLGVDIHADVSFSLPPTFELDIGTRTLAAGKPGMVMSGHVIAEVSDGRFARVRHL